MKAIEPTNFHGVGLAIAGLAVSAAGAGISAYGTAQNASATSDAAQYAALLESNFAKKQQAKVDALVAGKEQKLEGINTILDRFEGGGAFGSSAVLSDIRKAQSDFAGLGAGDFTGFQSQLDSILKGTLANTYGAGAAQGTFTQLAADTIMNLRQGGLQSALQTGEFLSRESQQLLGTEFGIMDQAFEQQYMIGRNKVSGITGNQMISAQQTGIGTQALGGAVGQAGSSMAGLGTFMMNRDMAQQQMDMASGFQTRTLDLQGRSLSLQEQYLKKLGPMAGLSGGVGAGAGGGGGGGGGGGSIALPSSGWVNNFGTPIGSPMDAPSDAAAPYWGWLNAYSPPIQTGIGSQPGYTTRPYQSPLSAYGSLFAPELGNIYSENDFIPGFLPETKYP